jgi:hypothetical protein
LEGLSSEPGGDHPLAIAGKGAYPLPLETRYALLLLTGSYGEIRGLAESIRKRLDQEEAGQKRSLFRNLYLQAVGSSNLFAAALAFYLIAYLTHNAGLDQTEDEDGRSVRGVDWARLYIAFMLNPPDHVGIVGGEGAVAESPREIAEQEVLRRQAHAAALRLASWTAASQQHVNELASKGLSPDDVVRGWLLRALVLSDRVLSLLIMESKAEPKMILLRLRGALDKLGISVNSDFYPDVFNPFLLGPEDCDHAVMSLLHILVLSWEDMCGAGDRLPFWWSDQIERGLVIISERPENEAEKHIRMDREQKKPNRLNVSLDRTPQELATALLGRARENHT